MSGTNNDNGKSAQDPAKIYRLSDLIADFEKDVFLFLWW
jgi:hypothetical protein